MLLKHKLLLLALLLLLFVGMAVAQSSTNFTLHRSVLLSGGAAESANYQVTSVIGQPAVGVVNGATHELSSGFLKPDAGSLVYLPLVMKP